MTGKELNHFQTLLVSRVAELQCQALRRDGMAVERNADQFDEIQRASERLLVVTNLDRGYTELQLAQAALRRIQNGTFGICQECEEDIHPKRLVARPWAPLCIHCQEAADRCSKDPEYGGGLLAA
jgi:DnaK suppressor protein